MIDENLHLHVATILGAHGIKGQLRLKVFLDDPMSIGDFGLLFGLDSKTYEITADTITKGVVVGREASVRFRDQAEALKGIKLYLPLDALPPPEDDEFYPFELEGLTVQNPEGEVIGQVLKVVDYGAGDLVEIRFDETGKSELFSFTQEAFPEIELEAGYLVFKQPSEILLKPQDTDEPKPQRDKDEEPDYTSFD